jgi:hypothetical protein
LDEKPSLSPGRVIVVLQPAVASAPQQRKLADVIDEIQRDQQALVSRPQRSGDRGRVTRE